MITKLVCQLDSEGYFVGLETAYESPRQPGVFLIPAGCVDTTPPVIPDGKIARRVNGQWEFEDAPAPELPEEPPAPPEDPALLAAEKFVGKFFSVTRLLKMAVWYNGTPREATPRLNDVFAWQEEVSQIAFSGGSNFPPPPFTFEEVAFEIFSLT